MKNKIIIIVLIIYTLIIMLPPIIYGYVYPNNGDDTAVHLNTFKLIQNGQSYHNYYYGQQLVAYPMIWLNNLFSWSINTQFLWFNYIALWLVGISIFILITKIINWKAGLISIPLSMFVSTIVLNLYDTGGIFDLLTVGVFLPLGLLCLTNAIASRKLKWIIPTVIFAVLVVIVHSLVIFAMGYVTIKQPTTPINEFIFVFLGLPLVMITICSLFYIIHKKIQLEYKEKILIWTLCFIIGCFGVLTFTQITHWATRFATDLAIIIIIFACVLVGIVIKNLNYKKVVWAIALVTVCFSIPMINSYYHYNSAVKPVDLEAIEYINGLSGDHFSCSPEIQPYIYQAFLNKTYRRGSFPYIKRSKSMTSQTNPDSIDYWWGNSPLLEYSLENAKFFRDKDIEIWVIAN